ncbi:MAG: Stp1/IreP family PP2C-type Ser/Thr phosphatase [Coriobacteriales bacterium]|nr:Stp1/IreP family PP2C-type Ser/Thr phosphatase [Actinomycetes bacterium]
MSARKQMSWYAGASDVGLIRADNEDAYLMEPPLFAVADGLGGHQAGEVASQLAIEVLFANAPKRADAKALGRAVRAANAAVIEAAAEGRGRAGMGTTLTAAMVEGARIAIAHVGDSRAYLLNGGQLVQLTQDHSMVADMVRSGTLSPENARVHPNRSVITRALGSDPNMVADTFEVEALPGDRLLLCSDGLFGMITDDAIYQVLATAPSPEAAVARLITAANDAGGQDNITAVVVDITGSSAAPSGSSGRSSASDVAPAASGAGHVWPGRVLWLVLAAAVVFGAYWGATAYARSQAFLIAENGYVAVYQGVPGSVAGIQLNWRQSVSEVPVTALDPVTAARLASGIRVEGLPAAYAVLDGYRSLIPSASVTPSSAEPTATP